MEEEQGNLIIDFHDIDENVEDGDTSTSSTEIIGRKYEDIRKGESLQRSNRESGSLKYVELAPCPIPTLTLNRDDGSCGTGAVKLDGDRKLSPQKNAILHPKSEDLYCSSCAKTFPQGKGPKDFYGIGDSIQCQVFNRVRNVLEISDTPILTILSKVFLPDDNTAIFRNKLICAKCTDILRQLYQLYNEYLAVCVMSDSVIGRALYRRRIPKKRFLKERQVQRAKLAKTHKKFQSENISENSTALGTTNLAVPSLERSTECITVKTGVTKESDNLALLGNSRKLRSAGNPVEKVQRKQEREKLKRNPENKCARCEKTFDSFLGLKVHFASHRRDDKKLTCKECGKKFQKEDALNMHTKIDHEGFKPHACPYERCGKTFRLKDKLKLHIKVIHEKTRPFPCTKCEKSFRTKYHLKVHDVSQHIQGDNSIGCSQCKRKFGSRDALEAHVKTHEESKPFTCGVCNKGFKTLPRLNLHMKSHDENPSYICSLCGKTYKHSRDLRLHEVIHQDESTYRFACGDCPKKFYRIDLLRVHQSNEQHFSPECVGPSISKLNRTSSSKVLKRKGHTNIFQDDMNEEQRLFDEMEQDCRVSSKHRRKSDNGKKRTKTSVSQKSQQQMSNSQQRQKPLAYQSTSDHIYQPNLESIAEGMSHHSLENSQMHSHVNFDKQNSDAVSDCNLKERAANHDDTNQMSSPLSAYLSRSTVSTSKDPVERLIPSFSIAAGAEQIGLDVISAFINNLN